MGEVMSRSKRPELWGGVECTLNRVHDTYHDQLSRSHHLSRLDDLDRFAQLGLRALRVPVLWERAQTERGARPSFSAVAPMLERTRELGIRVIAGLCHHGSGPPFTSLLDRQFAPALAEYAAEVARAFPWIEDYTPINEPVTTARFSALYGHWYPHAHDTPSFLRAVVNEVSATIQAMESIRKVQPNARLIQTEDIPWIRSTPELQYQADYENDRRFLAFDLLFGRVQPTHPLYEHLLENGISVAELQQIAEHACPPAIVGVNYYLTSDRYLDHRVELFPNLPSAGNGRHAYVDLDAVRVPGIGLGGHRRALQEVWDRYHSPIALTEVHAGCTREDQMRWLDEAWVAAVDAAHSGIDVRGFTIWSLLGSFDWDSLVRVEAGRYENGVFDLRAPEPRPTVLAHMVQALAKEGTFVHPVLAGRGWWRRIEQPGLCARGGVQPVLITGARGKLARALAVACAQRGLAVVALPREELDIGNRSQLSAYLKGLRPWAVINAAGFTRLGALDRDAARYFRDNVEGPVLLADYCARARLPFMTFTSDWVFDGKQRRPYIEADPVSPHELYGISQAEGERRILARHSDALIVRTSHLFGWSEGDEVRQALTQLKTGRRVSIAREIVASRTYVPHLVTFCLDLFLDGATGIWHLTNPGQLGLGELLEQLATVLGIASAALEAPSSVDEQSRVQVIRRAALTSERGAFMPSLESAIQDCARQIESQRG
jgi:dTDP-4-dehydrorhamnose reductase